LRLAHSRTVICSSWSLLNSPRAHAHIIIYKRARRSARESKTTAHTHTNLHHHSRFNQPCNKSKYKSKDKIYRVIICGSARTAAREETRCSLGDLIAATRESPFSGARGEPEFVRLRSLSVGASCGQNIQLPIA
jgi:hypothetical protein